MVPEDITITNTQSHMHARGVDYVAEVFEGDNRLMMYENTAWQNVPVKRHEPAMEVAGGSTIEFTCRVVCRGRPDRSESAAEVLDPPIVAVTAVGTVVVPAPQ